MKTSAALPGSLLERGVRQVSKLSWRTRPGPFADADLPFAIEVSMNTNVNSETEGLHK